MALLLSCQVSGNICCVVVEYISGGTLKEFLIDHYDSKLDMKTVLRLALGFARGLQYLHSKRIVHRWVGRGCMRGWRRRGGWGSR